MASELDMGTFAAIMNGGREVGWAWRQGPIEIWIIEEEFQIGPDTMPFALDFHEAGPAPDDEEGFMREVRLRCDPHRSYWRFTAEMQSEGRFTCTP